MSSSSSRSLITVGAAVAGAAVIGVALVMALGGTEPTVAVSGTSAVVSAPATTAGPVTTAPTAQTTVAQVSADPGDLLMTFGTAWTTTDWDLMRTVADQAVLDAAEEWAIAGGRAEINADNLDVILDSCFQDESGATRCEFLYLPPDGFALIFSAAFTATDNGLVMTGLLPGGDAG